MKEDTQGLIYPIHPVNQTPEDVAFYDSIMATIERQQEKPPYGLPDNVDFPYRGGTMRIDARLFPVEKGFAFIIGESAFFLEFFDEVTATEEQKHIIEDAHAFLDRRNEKDGVEYPSTLLAYVQEKHLRLKIEEDHKETIEKLNEMRKSRDKWKYTMAQAVKRFTVAEIAEMAIPPVDRSTMSSFIIGLRNGEEKKSPEARKIKTPQGKKYTQEEVDWILKLHARDGREGGRKSNQR